WRPHMDSVAHWNGVAHCIHLYSGRNHHRERWSTATAERRDELRRSKDCAVRIHRRFASSAGSTAFGGGRSPTVSSLTPSPDANEDPAGCRSCAGSTVRHYASHIDADTAAELCWHRPTIGLRWVAVRS